jgi:ORF6N domain
MEWDPETLAPVTKAKTSPKGEIVPKERVAASIYIVRGQKIMFDSDLAILYGVETKAFNQAVRRNSNRFPEDFMFQLTEEELKNLRSQSVTSSWGGRRYHPFAFTEHGVAMLSSVLRSKRAVQINIDIMRTFVRIRQMLTTSEELGHKVAQHDRHIAVLVEHVQRLLTPAPVKKKPMGFTPPKN